MNFLLIRHYLLDKGYTEDEIENDLSEIADRMYSEYKDEQVEREYAYQE